MKATFAFLADTKVHNLVRKLSWDIHQKYHTGIEITRLPPHISLKQPFDIPGFEALENYMAELADSIQPFEVCLTGLEVVRANMDGLETGILWLDVLETEQLRQLHNRLNRELSARFGDVRAPFDGPEYHFHMTVAMGGQPYALYQKILDEFSGRLVDLRFVVKMIAMFVYDDSAAFDKGYMTYEVLSLGKTASPPA